MRIFHTTAVSILLFGIVGLAGQKPKSDSTASFEGVVISYASGDPIEGARVALLKDPGVLTRSGTSSGSELPPELDWRYLSAVVFSDADGRFAFNNIDPKVFGFVVGANGYVRREFEREDFPENGKRFEVRMKTTGTVYGVVRSSLGRPLSNVSVQLLRYVYSDEGQRTLKPFGSSQTNDRGEYRLYGITPGRYYVRAGTSWMPSDYSFFDSVSPLFYPGVDDTAQASMVAVESGGVLGGIDFNVKRQESHRIRGRIFDNDPNGSPASNKTLRLYFLGGGFSTGDEMGRIWSFTRSSADGLFEFRNIVPGFFAITCINCGESSDSGYVQVQVGDSDVENISLTLTGSTINGRIRLLDGGPISAELRQYTNFRVAPVLPNGEVMSDDNLLSEFAMLESKDLDEYGKFTIENVLPLDYHFGTGWLPDGSYVKSAKFGGVDVLRQPFHPGDAGNTLEVVVASDSGSIAATVVDEKSKLARGAQVVLVPERERERADLYLSAKADRDGKVGIKSIPPGDYKLFAWESIEENSWFDPEVIQRFETKGKPVHVAEGSTQAMELRLIPGSK